jgi:hypothetical protein
MCRLVTCKKCQKPTWAGCGAHVEQVLGHVPPAARCACRETAPPPSTGGGIAGSIRRLFGGK